MSRRRARLWIVCAAVVALGVGLATAGAVLGLGSGSGGAPCQVVIGSHKYQLDEQQAANAVTISAVSQDLGMPHHAVTIAVAAGLQESGLHNLTHGDRDSVGIFQQRPSQGWGTPSQLLDPRYAAEAFLRGLAQVDGWEALPVTVAAQRVQRSATPDAYAKWEAEARAIARATTGEVAGALQCDSSVLRGAVPT